MNNLNMAKYFIVTLLFLRMCRIYSGIDCHVMKSTIAHGERTEPKKKYMKANGVRCLIFHIAKHVYELWMFVSFFLSIDELKGCRDRSSLFGYSFHAFHTSIQSYKVNSTQIMTMIYWFDCFSRDNHRQTCLDLLNM
jgi:hypothetical protein